MNLLPLHFSRRSLKSLPFGANIAALLFDRTLTVTTMPSDYHFSLNNVSVTASPIFDDGSLIIFGINRFLDPYFQISGPIRSYTPKNLRCLAPKENPDQRMELRDGKVPFNDASAALKSKGCSVMASFLELQFHGSFFKFQTMLTALSPFDQVLKNRVGNLSEYSSIFHRHVVPCRLLWTDLVSLNDGTVLRTNLVGFSINITLSNDVLMLNGVSVTLLEVYHNG
ncbi:putative fasciclin-like arabinogalactan protein 20 [Pyrus x bretschneideri]|uniref:putative fasciclin-like arabinogalactan protein 20 n=1 Tax=Pyrus x bretschneideri TaxID=225117 RepID=UPI0020308E1E|nr:putative fasciclin-like arabinogalactan protein 20 [Pyrus x bretschneideri]